MNTADKQYAELLKGNPPHADSGYFGLNLTPEEAELIIVPIPWDATTSYRPGTSGGPEAIRKASHQLDLEEPYYGKVFLSGLGHLPINSLDLAFNEVWRPKAEEIIAEWDKGIDPRKSKSDTLAEVNRASEELDNLCKAHCQELLIQKKLVGIVGGDHSSPLGLLQALNEGKETFSVLHLDAHHDLREAYEGFTKSHASIMFNALETCDNIDRLVSVGIRDYSEEEKLRAENDPRIDTFYDVELHKSKLTGIPFGDICEDLIHRLSDNVYISCDIDGLEPTLCPGTGTPVPGGLRYEEWLFLVHRLVESGRKIVGFDLCEVAGQSEWDANVGARVLYNLCGAALRSHKKLRSSL